MAEQRKLAAILAADVVGYSRLAGADEDRTLARLRALRSDLIDPTIAVHNGRVVKRTGDGALVEFRSVVDAVRCAIEVQNAMVERNAGLPPERRIEFRIGIHLGDVVEESDGDLMGDGVNIAARLEGVAAPGAICLSEDAYRQVRARLDLAVSDLGETKLKNIAEPMRVYSLQVGMLRRSRRPQVQPAAPEQLSVVHALPDKPSIAVLPFTNMSGDPEQDYFADGMVEDIITGLSRIKWLFVIARNSSFAYKGKAVDVRQVGRELGVRYVLEGSVRKAGEPRAHHRPADRRGDRAAHLGRALRPHARRRLRRSGRDHDERGRRHRAEPAPGGDRARQAQAARKSRRLRPCAARHPERLSGNAGWGREGGCRCSNAHWKWNPTTRWRMALRPGAHEILFARGGFKEENRLGAIRHAHAAIAHGRDDAVALSLGGFCMGLVAHDREAARQALDAALALSPSCALTFILGSVVMVMAGDAERGIEWGERALRLSPFDPMSYAPWLAIALGHLQRGEYEAAAEAAHKVFQANPYWSTAHVLLAATQVKLGRLDAAKSAARRVLELQPAYAISGFCASFDIHPSLATPLSEALSAAGLPA